MFDFDESRPLRGRNVREEPFLLQPGDNRPEPVRALDMERRREMVEEPGIVDEHGRWKHESDFKASPDSENAFMMACS